MNSSCLRSNPDARDGVSCGTSFPSSFIGTSRLLLSSGVSFPTSSSSGVTSLLPSSPLARGANPLSSASSLEQSSPAYPTCPLQGFGSARGHDRHVSRASCSRLLLLRTPTHARTCLTLATGVLPEDVTAVSGVVSGLTSYFLLRHRIPFQVLNQRLLPPLLLSSVSSFQPVHVPVR